MNNSIAVVIVTYNRYNLLVKSIAALRNQTHKLDGIIVVNNGSTDETEKWLTTQDDLLVFNQPNTGGSGGFHRGIKEANENGFDWIWVMDDDAFADEFAVEELSNAINKYGVNEDVCLYSNNDEDTDFVTDEKEIKHVMFVGFAVPAKIVKAIGLPRNDFFIYWDDAEYCERIVDSGYKIFKLKKSILNHKSFVDNQFYEKKLFNITVSFHKMSDLKLFYYLRNRLLMYKPLSKRWIKAVAYTGYIYVKILYLSNQKIIATKAIYNGLIRKSGIYNFK